MLSSRKRKAVGAPCINRLFNFYLLGTVACYGYVLIYYLQFTTCQSWQWKLK